MLVTGDHGGIDIPRDAHVIVDPALLIGVRHVSGEPRTLALHLEAGFDPDEVAVRWQTAEGRVPGWRPGDEAIAAGFFGDVDADVRPRIGDVLIAARTKVAYYLDANDRGRSMIGQHGSLTPDEVSFRSCGSARLASQVRLRRARRSGRPSTASCRLR